MNKTKALIICSTLALVGLLFIQVTWVYKSAQLKEEQFDQLVRIVLGRVAEAVCSNKEVCLKLGECSFDINKNDCRINIGQLERSTIDSLFNYYMYFHGIKLKYGFEITKAVNEQSTLKEKNSNYYSQHIEKTEHQKDLVLMVYFPEKKDFILAETGLMFISALVLIGLVIALWMRTVTSLLKEKQLYKRTIDFLNNMTHEFKTPLSAISLASRMLTKNHLNNKEDRIRHYSSIIYDENERLKMHVEKILNTAVLEKGVLTIDKKLLDIHKIIVDAVRSMDLLVQTRNGRINCALEATHYFIEGDSVHLTNAIYNLLDNANKYSADTPVIFVSTRDEEQHIIISICDKGIGIRKDQQKHIFDQFYRVPTGDIHNVRGFGLGLYYVKKVITELNGRVKVTSELGKGTCFELILPLVKNTQIV